MLFLALNPCMPLLHIHDASMSDSLKLHKPWALHTHRPRSQELSPDTSGWEGAWKNQFTSHRDRRSRRHESLPTPLLCKVWQLLKPKHSSDSEASVDVPQGCFHPLCRWLCSDTPVTLNRLLCFSLPAMLWPSAEVFCIYPRLLLRRPGLGCSFLEASISTPPSPTSPFSQLLHMSKSLFYAHVLLWIWQNILTSLEKGLGLLAFESFWTWHNAPY